MYLQQAALPHPLLPCYLQYLAEAVREFTGTREEVRVMVADCEDAIAGGDVAGALKRLRRVPESSPQYTRARMAMADIHLRHRKDQAAYIQCYIDLVVRSYVLHALLYGCRCLSFKRSQHVQGCWWL